MPTRLLPGSVGSFYVRVADVFIVLLYMWWLIACVASVSVWFRNKERPEKDRGRGLSVLTAREMKREPLAPLFSRSLTLVPRSFRLNRTETLATQARWLRTLKQKQYKLSISTSMLFIIFTRLACYCCLSHKFWMGFDNKTPLWLIACFHATILRDCSVIYTWGAIHSTNSQTGPTGKRGAPQKVDLFFRNFSGWTEPIHWVLDRNFRKFWLNGSRPWGTDKSCDWRSHRTAKVARTPSRKRELNSNWLTAGKECGSIVGRSVAWRHRLCSRTIYMHTACLLLLKTESLDNAILERWLA